ncbi:MAG: MlaD family protein [Rikenellaceae bacterium]|nr:MlaD family protein [Rikenellaceae bacterium]MCL2692395.1 MlaD family protein [Rikenellaceae bacterium]
MKIRREVKVGLYALLMMVALYWGINFLRGRDIFNRTNTYFATYDQVSGIQRSSPIVVRGYRVGVVSGIHFDTRHPDRVVLEFSINSRFHIPENSQARIFSDGLLGGRAVEIVMGNSERMLRNRDTLHSSMDRDLLERAGSELEFIQQKFGAVADALTKTLTSINKILEKNDANISGMMSNLSETTASLNSFMSTERRNLSAIVSNINSLTETLRRNTGHIDTMMHGLSAFGQRLAETDIKAIGDNLTAVSERLDSILAAVESGDGTLGRLVHDTALYDSLQEASCNLSLLLEDIRQHPGRYINISVFGRRSN